mmetsp:Transcript_15506/g.16094  ORF Transcript_15506/g.16094 Transcript_15506/m.16094 type:complete len:121 (+) Transcript_15506:16-378(+)
MTKSIENMSGEYNPPNTYEDVPAHKEEDRISNDQDFQDQIVNLGRALKSDPKFVCCPYCQKQGITKVEQNCSVLTGALCIVGLGFIWLGVQCCRKKDYNCRDADHFCVGCGNKLASYRST